MSMMFDGWREPDVEKEGVVRKWQVDYWRDRALKAEADASELRRVEATELAATREREKRLREEVDKRLEEMDELWKRMTRAELREKRLREALERISRSAHLSDDGGLWAANIAGVAIVGEEER